MFTNINLNPIESLLQDPDVTEIMVNSTDAVYIEKNGKLLKTDVRFETEEQLTNLIQMIVHELGRQVNTANPMVNVRMPDGSRFNAVLPPIAVNGPVLTIRKAITRALTWDELTNYGAVTPKIMSLLDAMVKANLSMVVSGGTGSGKTTIINALSEFIPHDERIVAAERMTELQLRHPHVIHLEARPGNSDGEEVTVTDLIINATMMRPDRLLMAEVVGDEIWAMLQVMSSGYDGTIFGIHATSVQDALERIELMATAATNLPLLQIRSKIAQSIQVIVQQTRMSDGKRRIVTISEVTGLKNSVVETQDIMRYEDGIFRFTGYVPTFVSRLGLDEDFFNS